MLKKTLAALAFAVVPLAAQGGGGIPTLRGGDHIGFTVPDLRQAIRFFVDVIGCQEFYPLGPFKFDDDWMTVHLNVDARAAIDDMRLLRCGYGNNLELFQYTASDQNSKPPRNSDVGGHHIAFYVDDINAAVEYLRANKVQVLGDPKTTTEGPTAGESWVYFLTPWGMQLELVSYPNGKAYEKDYSGNLWYSGRPAE
jgi:catechol 2,3-dioxygenase-like lactoylglutathione lyase family enzyme